VMRYGENALNVIDRIKERFKEVTLPDGVELVVIYDRSDLILKSISTLRKKLAEEMSVVFIVILIFLFHIPSAVVPIVTLPIAILLSFIPLYYLGLTSNIMSLGGIAIAIGAMADASIALMENAYKKLSEWKEKGGKNDQEKVLLNSLKEVGRPAFFSLLVIAIAFMPIFALEAYEGRMFKPLAYTKNLAMLFAAVLAVTLTPAVRTLFMRLEPYTFRPKWLCLITNFMLIGKYYPEENHPISKFLFKIYIPTINFVFKKPKTVILGALFLFILSMPVFFKIR